MLGRQRRWIFHRLRAIGDPQIISNFIQASCLILSCGRNQEWVQIHIFCKDEYQYMLRKPNRSTYLHYCDDQALKTVLHHKVWMVLECH